MPALYSLGTGRIPLASRTSVTSKQPRPASISCAAASPAKTSALQAAALGSQAAVVDCGSSSSAWFAFYDPRSSSWRTYRGLQPISTLYSGRWPSSGSMRSGTCSTRPRSVPRTCVSGSSFLPTPLASDSSTGNPVKAKRDRGTGESRTFSAGLRDMVALGLFPTPVASTFTSNRSTFPGAPTRLTLEGMARSGRWPTPTATDAKSGAPENRRKHPPLRDAVRFWATPKAMDADQPGRTPGKATTRQPLTVQVGGGRLNPEWVEWLMGLPIGWTHVADEAASAALATARCGSKSTSRS